MHNGLRRIAWPMMAAIASCSFVAQAQVPDLVELSGQYTPSVRVADPQPLEAQVTSYDAAFNVPIPLSEHTFVIPGAAYHAESVSFGNGPDDFVPLRAFHAVDVPLLLVQLLPHDWALSLRLAPGLAGDFAAVDRSMLRFSAVALATHSFSDDFLLGGGFIGSYAFGGFLPLPAAYVEYRPTPQFSIEAFLPAFARAKLSLFDRLELGYRVEVQGNAYAVRDERIASSGPCASGAQSRNDCLDHLAYSVVAAGPTLDVRLFHTVWWTAFAGHTLHRRFDLMNRDGEPVTGGAQGLPNTWLVRTGLSWRVPME
jgi:Domain of unknown function (DUF6268)